MEWIIPLLFGVGLIAPVLQRIAGDRAGACLALVPAAVAVYAAALQPAIAVGEIPTHRSPWVPALGIEWAFRIDGLANLFVILVAGIGALIVLYASVYLRDNPRLGRFYAFLFVFMAAMLGLAASDDVFLLFVFWEVTTISSFLLIGFTSDREAARSAARQSLLVTATGGLALLTGLLLLVSATGTTSLSEITSRADLVRADPHYPWILAFVLFGCFTKSAQFPFHFWLPAAMQAPTPVSAYLHSSTMVKAGVFVLARLSPALGGTEAWLLALAGVGTVTLLLGAAFALGQDDLKALLAYSTIAVLGLLTVLLGLGTPIAARAFAVTLVAHAFYKATLFLVAGNVDHSTGTRSLARLGGLRKAMPWTAAAALVAGVSMAGAPPLFGFLAKETAYEAMLEAPTASFALGTAVFAMGACLVFAALRVAWQPFATGGTTPNRVAGDPPLAMRLGPVVLAAAGMLAGMLVGPAERLLISPAADAILQEQAPTGLALWHGFTPILALSVLTLTAGLLLFAARSQVLETATRAHALESLGLGRFWDRGWRLLLHAGATQARLLQNGSLRRYLAITTSVALAAVAWGVARSEVAPELSVIPAPSLIGAVAGLLVMGGAIGMLTARTPFVAVALLGAVGFGVSLLFLVYSAPDLALTQLVVEVLTVVLFVFVLRRLPRPAVGRARAGAGSLLLALSGGATMGLLTLLAAHVDLAAPISGFFAEQSVPGAHGRNVVNVILVDFRALDTLGEITVLAAAALGILALLARRRGSAGAEASS